MFYLKTDILRQNRLTIVINKKDSAIERATDEDTKSYTCEEVIFEVREFLCNDVFKCTDKDLPEDSVILVSGWWALFARQHKSSSPSELKNSSVTKVLSSLTDTTLFKAKEDVEFEEDVEIEKENIPQCLEQLDDFSNVRALEYR